VSPPARSPQHNNASDTPWAAVVALKALQTAKTRMHLNVDLRRRLVIAMLNDTLEAVRGSATVGRVLLVCDDQSAAAQLDVKGVDVVSGEPAHDLNSAFA
jgi:2-phospho-L-lactate guanylyltransferase (CobY/MobA/RfbA family)